MARFIRNDRLADALHRQAQSTPYDEATAWSHRVKLTGAA
jgi:hypothetical protein